jgi:hypothetical protein
MSGERARDIPIGWAAAVMAPASARAAGVVETGTAASCIDAALNVALAGGGTVTFNCGGPVELDISRGSGTKTSAVDTTLDGAGQITISGGHMVRVFQRPVPDWTYAPHLFWGRSCTGFVPVQE